MSTTLRIRTTICEIDKFRVSQEFALSCKDLVQIPVLNKCRGQVFYTHGGNVAGKEMLLLLRRVFAAVFIVPRRTVMPCGDLGRMPDSFRARTAFF